MERSIIESMNPFYTESHAGPFREYFSILNAAGVETLTTVEDSVVSDAGAFYVRLSVLLGALPSS